MLTQADVCPQSAPFFGFMGAAAAVIFTCFGGAYGTAKAGIGVSATGVLRPELINKSVTPIIMAGVLGIYGLIDAVLIVSGIANNGKYALYTSFAHLASGLSVGLCGLAAGYSIGITGDAGVRGFAQQPRLFVGLLLMLIFGEALALYGLIVGLVLQGKKSSQTDKYCTE